MNNGKFQEDYKKKLMPLEDAARLIKTGDMLVVASGLNNPVGLLDAIGKRVVAGEFDDVQLVTMGLLMAEQWVQPQYSQHLRLYETFIFSPHVRAMINEGVVECYPCHGSEIPKLITDYIIKDLPPGKTKVMSSV